MPFDPLAYWEQRLTSFTKSAGVGCIGLSEAYNQWLHRVKARVFKSVIESIEPVWDGKRILDVGSGRGFCVEQWKRAGARDITASDFTEQSISDLGERWPDLSLLHLDITKPLSPIIGRYDTISAVDVFFHIPDDDAYRSAFANVARLLLPGGHFVFTENFLHGRDERTGPLTSRDIRHVQRILHHTGLVPLGRWPVFVVMNRPIDSASRLRNWVWERVERLARPEATGWATGAILYPLELLLLCVTTEGPSTELMVCRKSDDDA